MRKHLAAALAGASCVAFGLLACGRTSSALDQLLTDEENNERRQTLLGAVTLRCQDPIGVSASWDNAGPATVGKPGPMFNPPAALVFDMIDTSASRARFVGNAGAGDVSVSITGTGLHFVEQSPSGSLMITTVFADGVRGVLPREFFFVHSRHVGGAGFAPIVSQFTGKCEAQ